MFKVEAWEEYDMEMTNVNGGVRFVRFVEHIQTLYRGKVVEEETKEILLVTTSGEEVKLESLCDGIFENCLSHQLKTHCHLDQRFVDGLNAITACIYL